MVPQITTLQVAESTFAEAGSRRLPSLSLLADRTQLKFSSESLGQLPLSLAEMAMDEKARGGVSDTVKMACDSKGAGHGVFATGNTDGDYTIGAQHVLNVRSERDRMRLAAVIDKRRLRKRNLSERDDRAYCCYLIRV
jgi:hypothetical protein